MTRPHDLDAWDVILQAAVTLGLAFAASTMAGGRLEGPVAAAVFAVSGIVLGVRRWVRRRGGPGLGAEDEPGAQLDSLDQRVTDLELLQARLLELEERVDFSERLLAAGRPASAPLAPPAAPAAESRR